MKICDKCGQEMKLLFTSSYCDCEEKSKVWGTSGADCPLKHREFVANAAQRRWYSGPILPTSDAVDEDEITIKPIDSSKPSYIFLNGYHMGVDLAIPSYTKRDLRRDLNLLYIAAFHAGVDDYKMAPTTINKVDAQNLIEAILDKVKL